MKYNKALNFMTWVVYPLLIIGIILACCYSCDRSRASASSKGGNTGELKSESKKAFTLPVVPAELTLPKERAMYVIRHYWDQFDFNDTAYIHLPRITEQAFADYAEVLPHGDKDEAIQAIGGVLTKASQEESGKMYTYFIDLLEKYLYDPTSPLRNEEFYIGVAQDIIQREGSDEAQKERARFKLELMLKNRVGEPANDFTYMLASKREGRLYQLESEYVLVYFHNPDCEACAAMLEGLKQNLVINRLVEHKRLKILAIYPDSDLAIWKKHLTDIPSDWINAYDEKQVIESKKVYDLKAIPSLYLLDKEKKVVLKDVDINVLNEWLEANIWFPVKSN